MRIWIAQDEGSARKRVWNVFKEAMLWVGIFAGGLFVTWIISLFSAIVALYFLGIFLIVYSIAARLRIVG